MPRHPFKFSARILDAELSSNFACSRTNGAEAGSNRASSSGQLGLLASLSGEPRAAPVVCVKERVRAQVVSCDAEDTDERVGQAAGNLIDNGLVRASLA